LMPVGVARGVEVMSVQICSKRSGSVAIEGRRRRVVHG
jgi:hypothetical protein